MKLFLASEAKHPETIKELEKFIGGFSGKSIAYIPTAGNGEGWESWKDSRTWSLLQTLGIDATLVQLEDHTNEEIRNMLTSKDIIWFAGGQCGYLMYWIRRREVDSYLKSLLDAGTIYVGSSAGSMVTAPTLDIVEWYWGENERGAGVIPGLGLVDFDIYPHYSEDVYEHITQHYKGKKVYLLKNGEEVIVDGETIRVIGEERVIPR